MKTTHIFLGLVMLCATAFGSPAPVITATPTNGPTTVTVHARTTDGKVPVGEFCSMFALVIGTNTTARLTKQNTALISERDWTATEIPPGNYAVALFGTNYLENPPTTLRIFEGTNYTVDVVLSRGATLKGRVLDAATGKPIANIDLRCKAEGPNFVSITDAQGHYEFFHIVGAPNIQAIESSNYLGEIVKVDAAAEGDTISVPDIRLQPGGKISGWVARPTGLPTNYPFAWVRPEIQGSLSNNLRAVVSSTNGMFHIEPLPPGTYTLHADWNMESFPIVSPTKVVFWQTRGSVSNITVVAGQATTNVIIPIKMIGQTNRVSGR